MSTTKNTVTVPRDSGSILQEKKEPEVDASTRDDWFSAAIPGGRSPWKRGPRIGMK